MRGRLTEPEDSTEVRRAKGRLAEKHEGEKGRGKACTASMVFGSLLGRSHVLWRLDKRVLYYVGEILGRRNDNRQLGSWLGEWVGHT